MFVSEIDPIVGRGIGYGWRVRMTRKYSGIFTNLGTDVKAYEYRATEQSMSTIKKIGFIGLGVMGEPMCPAGARNIQRLHDLARAWRPRRLSPGR
jgi:hypothetical protein